MEYWPQLKIVKQWALESTIKNQKTIFKVSFAKDELILPKTNHVFDYDCFWAFLNTPLVLFRNRQSSAPHTLRETWKKPKSRNCFKIWVLVVDCMLINKWNMILDFEKAEEWFLMVKGVTFSTKKWKAKWVSLSILSLHQNEVFVMRVWLYMVISKGNDRQYALFCIKVGGLAKTVFETNRRIFLKLMHNHMHIESTLLNKKSERLRDSIRAVLAEFLQKINFFQVFLHFWNQLDELVWKMVLFFNFEEILISDMQKSNFWSK